MPSHPELRSTVDAAQAIYWRARAEADDISRAERARWGAFPDWTDGELERWHEAEVQARRRLVTLMGNQRLVGM
jgi:hypothetical protein